MSALTERKAVQDAFDRISEHWNRARKHPWPDLITFLEKQSFQHGSKSCIDIAAANGRHTRYMSQFSTLSVGIDLSLNLLRLAKKEKSSKNCDYIQADASFLPFRENVFNKSLFISGLHHLPSESRVQSLQELKRVLSVNGQCLVTVWVRDQEKFIALFLIDLILLTFLHSKSKRFGDIFVPWKGQDGRIIASRFYHLFSEKELKNLLKKAGLKVLESQRFGGKSGRDNVFTLVKMKNE